MEDEVKVLLTQIVKKQDKILNMLTKTMKALHLLPVTEKEEKDLQIQQRTNLKLAAKVNSDLDKLENIVDEEFELPKYTTQELYGDVLADDILGGDE